MLSEIVASAIDLSFIARRQSGAAGVLSGMAFAREYCTVSLGVPRQSGKTRFIATHAEFNDMVIVPDQNMLMHYHALVDFNAPIITMQDILRDSTWSTRNRYHRIYFDEVLGTGRRWSVTGPTGSDITIADIITRSYDIFLKDENQTFIFLHT